MDRLEHQLVGILNDLLTDSAKRTMEARQLWLSKGLPEDLFNGFIDQTGSISSIEDVLELGFSQRELGELFGKSKQFVSLYLKKHGYHERWKEGRERRMNEIREASEEAHRYIIQAINARVNSQANSWAEQKAVEYIRSLPYASDIERKKLKGGSLDYLVELFSRYKQAVESGERRSLAELGNGLGLYPSAVSDILRRVCLKPMYDSRRRVISQETRAALNRAYKTSFSIPDIAHLLGLSESAVRLHFGKMDNNRKYRRTNIRTSARIRGEIYLAEDLGFTPQETSHMLNRSISNVSYVLEHRAVLGEQIMLNLRIMFPHKNIDKPYIS